MFSINYLITYIVCPTRESLLFQVIQVICLRQVKLVIVIQNKGKL
uniref:Uncharacterized protein n=1 Tax=Anguilla anguilla TaxID=7936 RepID=A0A0E9XKI9_ANGAN